MKKIISSCLVLFILSGCAHTSKDDSVEILPASKVNWEKLNPARGDKSPQAATLWGDRKGNPATGFLVKFVDGFSSPPHIHNVSYKGIVISGLVHNDDPKAANMWMPATSYWTQPAGESHITSAKGKTNIAFIEIDSGPYLVRPKKMAFDNGERPFNIHSANTIWKDGKVELWKDKSGRVTGSMFKFRGHHSLKLSQSKIVVISGKLNFEDNLLEPGSLISVNGKKRLSLNCESDEECVLYLKN